MLILPIVKHVCSVPLSLSPLLCPAGSSCSYKYLEQPPFHTLGCNPHHSRQLNLQCTAFSRNSNFSIQWKWLPLFTKSAKPLQDVNITHLSTSNNTAFVVFSTLTILSLSDSKAGTYWCQIVSTNVNQTLLRSSVYFLLISAAYHDLPSCDNDKVLKTSIIKCADPRAQVESSPQPRNQAAVSYSTTPLPSQLTVSSTVVHRLPLPTPTSHKPTPVLHNIATKTISAAISSSRSIATWHHNTISPTISPSQLLTNDTTQCNFCSQRDLLLVTVTSFLLLSIVTVGLFIVCIIGLCYHRKA